MNNEHCYMSFQIDNYGNNYSIIVGIIVYIIGRFGLNLPIKLFKFTKHLVNYCIL